MDKNEKQVHQTVLLKFIKRIKSLPLPKISFAVIPNLIFFCWLLFFFLVPKADYIDKLGEAGDFLYEFSWRDNYFTFHLSSEFIFSFVTILLGVLFLFFNRNRLKEMDDQEKLFNIDRFILKNPLIAKLYKIAGVCCPLILLSFLVIFAAFQYNNDISRLPFQGDEYQVIETAIGYNSTGQFRKWNFCNNKIGRYYERAFPHTWMIAKSFLYFGVSEWSARIVSVFFGCLFILSFYFISKYFLKSTVVALLITLILVLDPWTTVMFKVARMYAVLIPSFLLLFYLVHRALLAYGNLGTQKIYRSSFLLYFSLCILLLLFNYLIHINSLVILPIFLVLTLFHSVFYRKKRFWILVVLGACTIILTVFIFPNELGYNSLKNHIGVLTRLNNQYFYDLVKIPFRNILGFSFVVLGFFFIIFVKRSQLRNRILTPFVAVYIGLIFFIYVADRYYAYKYVSFLTPICAIYILQVFLVIVKCYKSKLIRITLLVTALLFGTEHITEESFILKPSEIRYDYKKAYGTIMSNFKKDGNEIIVGQFLRCYYMKGFIENVNQLSLGKNESLSYEDFISRISDASSGWVTWRTNKKYHINNRIVNLVWRCFKHHHGENVDGIEVEVFSFNQTFTCLQNARVIPSYFKRIGVKEESLKKLAENKKDSGNLQTKNKKKSVDATVLLDITKSFTISLWVKTKKKSPLPPFALGVGYKENISVEKGRKGYSGGYRFRYSEKGRCSAVATGPINDGKWHHIAFFQTGGKINDVYGVYVDGSLVENCRVEREKKKKTKFTMYNMKSGIQDIRIYPSTLDSAQIEMIFNNHKITLEHELTANGKTFKPEWHWKNTKDNDY